MPNAITVNVKYMFELQDVTEEDIDAELAVIHSQMAFVMQLQGRTEDALQLYNQVIKLKCAHRPALSLCIYIVSVYSRNCRCPSQ